MKIKIAFVLGLGLAVSGASWAKVSEQEAQALKNGTLTPLGAEKKGNADGSIPAWDGGLKEAPAGWKAGDHLIDPFPNDKPLFTITSENLAKYRDKLTAGQIAMFEHNPKTWRMPVYQSRRTQINAQYIYDATYQNALKAVLADGSDSLQNAAMGIPFPIPKIGTEVIWNHKLRHTGYIFRRWNSQIVVAQDGSFTETKLREDNYAPYIEKGMTPEKINQLMAIYFLQVVKAPPRMAGTVNLALSPMDQKKQPQMVWTYNAGQKRTRRAPMVSYDTPDPGTDSLSTVDQVDIFNGALDRYSWKIVGKKEIYMPANGYRIHNGNVKYKDLVRPKHINPEYTRYEMHRVWVLEANIKPGTHHVYTRRTFYQDEDSWAIVGVDNYDAQGKIWRVQEAPQVIYYGKDDPHPISAVECIYDFVSGRYAMQTLNNESEEYREMNFNLKYFDTSNMEKVGGG